MSDRSKPLKKRYSKIVAYKKTFSTTEGREVLLDMMNVHNVFDSTFDIDNSQMCRKEGERNVVLRLMTILKITPSQMQDLAEEIEKNVRTDADPNNDATGINW